MSRLLQRALQAAPDEPITANRTIPFGNKTQIRFNGVYNLKGIMPQYSQEPGSKGELVDVLFRLIDDRGIENHFSHSNFIEYQD